MGLAPVGCFPELYLQTIEGLFERERLVVGFRLGTHDGSPAAKRDLDLNGIRGVLGAICGGELHLHTDHPVPQPLDGHDPVADQFLELGADGAVPTGDDDVHVSSWLENYDASGSLFLSPDPADVFHPSTVLPSGDWQGDFTISRSDLHRR